MKQHVKHMATTPLTLQQLKDFMEGYMPQVLCAFTEEVILKGVDDIVQRLEGKMNTRFDALGILLESLTKQLGEVLTMFKAQQEEISSLRSSYQALEVRVRKLEAVRAV